MKAYSLFALGIVLLALSFLIKFDVVDLHFHDAYFLINVSHLIRIIALLMCVLALLMWFMPKVRNSKSTKK